MEIVLQQIMENPGAIIQSALSGFIGVLFTTLFLRKNAKNNEFEKIKAGKFSEVIGELLSTGKMTYYEYYKCSNFLKVAQLADNELKKKRPISDEKTYGTEKFDFDWFIRFFDSVGNISNEDMQLLWARVLAGEIKTPGSFSLRTLETLRNMTRKEAEVFGESAEIALKEISGDIFLFSSSNEIYDDINELFDFGDQKLLVLEECGLLNGMRLENKVFNPNSPYGIYNKKILLHISLRHETNPFIYRSYSFTQTALQLFPIINVKPNNNYILALGKQFKNFNSDDIEICAYKIKSISGDDFNCDTSKDLLVSTRKKRA